MLNDLHHALLKDPKFDVYASEFYKTLPYIVELRSRQGESKLDEIETCLNRQVEELLYPAMEDFAVDIVIGKGATAKAIRLGLPKFTLVGATTRAGMLSAPLRDRFGVVHRLEFYTVEMAGPVVIFRFTPISFAIIPARVVFPSPGEPKNKT